MNELENWVFSQETLNTLKINKFNTTWADIGPQKDYKVFWKDFGYFYDEKNQKHFFDKTPNEHIVSGRESWKVKYEYNLNFFRCDNFKTKHDGLHILFLGCSCTEGMGDNIERNWTHILYNKIKEENQVSGYFNLGRSGNGWHNTITNYLNYVKSYGHPDIVFILLPNVLRNFVWDNKRFWNYDQKFPTDSVNQINFFSEEEKTKIPTFEEYTKEFPNFIISWKLFIEYIKLNKTKILWSSWDSVDSKNVKHSGLFEDSHFVFEDPDEKDFEKLSESLKFNQKDLVGRDGHPGFVPNKLWADHFYKNAKERGVL